MAVIPQWTPFTVHSDLSPIGYVQLHWQMAAQRLIIARFNCGWSSVVRIRHTVIAHYIARHVFASWMTVCACTWDRSISVVRHRQSAVNTVHGLYHYHPAIRGQLVESEQLLRGCQVGLDFAHRYHIHPSLGLW